ncbi:MAG: hypothetical protein ABEK50_12570 [bacterium]
MIRHYIEEIPGEAREQVEHIYAEKGFEAEALEEAVDTIVEDEFLCGETLVRERWGMSLDKPNAAYSAESPSAPSSSAG